jgi:glycosyltransferase involved in cell wall biosynthesis
MRAAVAPRLVAGASSLLGRGAALLDTPGRLALAVERLPATWRGAATQRLEVLAAALQPSGAQDVAPTTVARLDLVLERLGTAEAPVAWLTLAVLTAELPLVTDVQRLQRAVRLDGPLVALRPLLLRAGMRESLTGGRPHRVEVTGGVVVDVAHTARTGLATGIQRVTRETVRRWDASHDLLLAGWGDGLLSLRRLDAAEQRQALTGSGGVLAADEPSTRGVVLVPWQGTYLLPELAPERERTLRIMALARFSGCRTATIGYDCVPISSAETTDHGVSEAFAGYLAAARHLDVVAAISEAAAQEYSGWKTMLRAIGVPGPEVRAVPLPTEPVQPSDADRARARDRFVVGDLPLLLCVGTHEPRKNHLALLHAAETAWRAGHRFSLSFVGGHSWHSERFTAQLEQLRQAGRAVDSHRGVDDGLLWGAYAISRAVVFPSLHEGYGLPVAEALAVGTPAVTSAHGSMAEIAREGGALLVDPRDDRALADALAAVVSDPATVSRLRAEAAARPHRTWDAYAATLWTLFTDPEAAP